MRTTTLALASAALLGLGLAATPATATPAETRTEKGIVLECTGRAAGLSASVTLYENSVYTHSVQVVLDDDPKRAGSREPKDIWSAGEVRTSVRVAGKRATVTGTATRTGAQEHVHEEVDDAGAHIVSDGFHRRLDDDLVLGYGGVRMRLTCAPAFYYRLDVTRTPL